VALPVVGPWGIAVPGPFDYATGVARYRGVGKFGALDGVDVGKELATRLGVPASALRFLNDAAAFGLGAWQHGPAAGAARLVAITLGTGVGSAFVADGTVVADGPRVPPEGRADLLTIDGHPLEDTVSTRALTARYTALTTAAGASGPADPVDGLHDLTGRASAGDVVAREVVESAMGRLGEALAPWLVAFGAGSVVFGGSITAAWPLIGPPLLAALTAHDPRLTSAVRITVTTDGERTALLGAALHTTR
jgi:glucokinase